MEDSRKKTYEFPVTEVIGIKLEGIVCTSGEIPDFGSGWDFDFIF